MLLAKNSKQPELRQSSFSICGDLLAEEWSILLKKKDLITVRLKYEVNYGQRVPKPRPKWNGRNFGARMPQAIPQR